MLHRWQRFGVLTFQVVLAVALRGQSKEWFQDKNHDKKNRWEGLLGEDHSSPGWDLRSFLANVEPYPMDKSVDLTITYYVPDGVEAFVEAQAIRPTVDYLMQPKPAYLRNEAGWRKFAGWSTGDVLLPKRIASENLGLLIRLGGDSKAVNRLSPGMIYYSSTPKPVKTYRLDFFTMRGLAPFSFDVVGVGGYRRPYPNQPGTASRSTVSLEFDAVAIPEGRTRVILMAPFDDSPMDKLRLEIEFYNKRFP